MFRHTLAPFLFAVLLLAVAVAQEPDDEEITELTLPAEVDATVEGDTTLQYRFRVDEAGSYAIQIGSEVDLLVHLFRGGELAAFADTIEERSITLTEELSAGTYILRITSLGEASPVTLSIEATRETGARPRAIEIEWLEAEFGADGIGAVEFRVETEGRHDFVLRAPVEPLARLALLDRDGEAVVEPARMLREVVLPRGAYTLRITANANREGQTARVMMLRYLAPDSEDGDETPPEPREDRGEPAERDTIIEYLENPGDSQRVGLGVRRRTCYDFEVTGEADFVLEVLDQAGEIVAQTDSEGEGDGELLADLWLEPGRYTVIVRGSRDEDTGQFRLVISRWD